MRQIGTLPKTSDPRVLVDYLLAQGVSSRANESEDGWAIWVHNEDHLPQAREAFSAYEQDPDGPRFTDAAEAARAARVKAERLDRQYRKNVRDVSGTWGRVRLRSRPLTIFLCSACVAVFLAGQSSVRADRWLDDRLLFFPLAALAHPQDVAHGLDAIRGGEVWRLFTPIFLHGGILHLLFNVWALMILGTIIEARRGTARLLTMVVASALVSNLVQYLFVLNFDHKLVPWAGISGVGYALFGYLWMKGQVDPEPGMVLHPSTIRIMLLFLILGFMGAFGTPDEVNVIRMANGAHVGGLVVGMLFGLLRF